MLSAMLFVLVLISGCGKEAASQPFELDIPPEVNAKLETIPNEPIAGESAVVRVLLLDEIKPKDGMRIELRNNDRATRLYDAKEKMIDGSLAYEIEAIFETSGENLVTYHFNADNYHIMSSFTVEVK